MNEKEKRKVEEIVEPGLMVRRKDIERRKFYIWHS